jgi:hypothetical protein
MRFRHGVLLMVTVAAAFVVAVTAIALALTGDSGGHRPVPGGPPLADSSAETVPSHASDPTPEPRGAARRPRTSSSTLLGSSSPRPTVRPSTPPMPDGLPSRWPQGDPRHPRWHHTPPWWYHR